MMGSDSVRLALTALFAALGTWYLASALIGARSASTGRGAQALGSALHVVMSAAMISMLWSWGADVPVIAQVTLFTAAAGWFAGQAIFGAGGHHAVGCYGNWYHAGMMAVMVWMPVAMQLMTPPSPDGGMSGMAMPGGMAGMAMGGQSPAGSGGTVTSIPVAGWPGSVCVAAAVALFAAAAWQAVAALRPLATAEPRPGPGIGWHGTAGVVLRDGVGAFMAAGMAVALLQMA